MQDARLFIGTEPVGEVVDEGRGGAARGAPRVLKPDRAQARLEPVCLEDRLPADHRARLVWRAVERLDLSLFHEPIAAREGIAGRAAVDPRLLVALWLYASIDGVGSGRELARLCESDDAYRWLCGGVGVCYHTLNDFRVGHERALDALFTQVIGRLTHAGLVTVVRVAQDGTRVRAAAGTGSFRSEATLRTHLDEARRHVAALKAQRDDPAGPGPCRVHALRAAEDRERRLEAALAELPKVAALKQSGRTDRPSRSAEPRVSTTDPQARKMRMGDGGYRPAYNVQLAADTASRAIVGMTVSQSGTDSGLCRPMREQVEARVGLTVAEHLTDGGYTRMADVTEGLDAGVSVYRPPPTPHDGRTSPYQPVATDPAEQAMWRELMGTPECQEVYRERASTIETVNADLKAHRGLGQFPVRGVAKATCVMLWLALAYNLIQFAEVLATG